MKTDSLLDLLQPTDRDEKRYFGVVVGIVTNNRDPEGRHRVKLRFPWLSDTDESDWARLAVPMAGKDRGLCFLPEVEDQVLVAFEHGDLRFPYVLGALWNGVDTPPQTNEDGKNNIRLIKSRSGHLVRLDDTDGAEKIEIIDKTGKNSLVFDSAANTVTISAEADLTLASRGGKLVLKGKGIEITSGKGLELAAKAEMNLKANANTNIKGAIINLN